MKTRRGLSTVVGAVFAIIAITTTIAYVSYSTNLLNQYNNTVLVKNQALTDSNKEKFQISSVVIAKSKLNITLANTGPLPINVTKIWIQNTTTTDWIHGYTATNSFVSPGATLTNLGQNIPAYINPANSYNVKLVTSRGTSQAFAVNSASAAPLNIQLFALPASVTSGVKSELMMIVTNNGSSILTNISPSTLPAPTGSATCTAGSVSPSIYNTIPPGGTAIFKWDVTVSGSLSGQTCTYTLNQPLQNGYSQTVQATMTVNTNYLSSSTYSLYNGLVSINYTSFRWTEGVQWNKGWSAPWGNPIAFSLQVSNNNGTVGGNLYLANNTALTLFSPVAGEGARAFYIVKAISFSPLSISQSYQCTGPPLNNYCINIPPNGTATLYFAAKNPTNSLMQSISNPDGNGSGNYIGFLLVFGQFSSAPTSTGTLYGQNIPSIGFYSKCSTGC